MKGRKRRQPAYGRENKGFDFGAWSVGLDNINKDDYESFIFINSSVIGPFVSDTISPWPAKFLNQLQGDVKLTGTTINCSNCVSYSKISSGISFGVQKERS